MRREAEEISAAEPALAGFIYATRARPCAARGRGMPSAVAPAPAFDVDLGLLYRRLRRGARVGSRARRLVSRRSHRYRQSRPGLQPADRAVALFRRLPCARDPSLRACAVEGRPQGLCRLSTEPVLALLQVDIHPAARDRQRHHLRSGHGLVIGETAVVGDDVSMLHGVTLGGSGKERRPASQDRAWRDDRRRRQDPRQYQDRRLRASGCRQRR